MLGGDRGMRGAPMTDIARFDGSGGFAVFATLTDDTEISVTFNPGDTNRRAKIDNESTTLSDLASHLRIVWITPREDRLFVDAASERRAFFDHLGAGFDSAHAGRVGRLTKLLSERAFALKNGQDQRWIDALDIQIAATATAVAAARIQYAGELNYFLKNYAISVNGILEKMVIDFGASVAERNFLDYLKNNRELLGDKMLLDGPHKSDFGMFNMELQLPVNLTSTGQQKNALLNLVLSHARLIHTKTGKQPLILLDEAAAHLDTDARTKLFNDLIDTNAQVWATGLDSTVFQNVKNAAFVTCINGEINNILVP